MAYGDDTPTRFVPRIAMRYKLTKSWGACDANPDEYDDQHEATVAFVDYDPPSADFGHRLLPKDHPRYAEAAECLYCGEVLPEDEEAADVFRGGGAFPLYDTDSGNPEPGDLFVDRHDPAKCWLGWTNCAGVHLHCVLPNGRTWLVSQRASNCGRPTDTEHRCWVLHGDAERGEQVHVDKDGDTCAAGAGSILAGDWHGFLHHGVLREV